MKHKWTKGEAWGKITAGFFGGFLVFLVFGMAMGTGLPLAGISLDTAVSLSVILSVPVWSAAILYAKLAHSGWQAWKGIGLTFLGLALVVVLAKYL